MIYFVQEGGSNSIKIGFSASPGVRIKSLSTGCPFPLTLLFVMEGDKSIEAGIHALFSKFRLNGEWFSPAPEILDFIKNPTPITPHAPVIRRKRQNETISELADRWDVVGDYETLSADQVRCLLAHRVRETDMHAWGRAQNPTISPGYINDVIKGRKPPGPKILAALGLCVCYVPTEEIQS